MYGIHLSWRNVYHKYLMHLFCFPLVCKSGLRKLNCPLHGSVRKDLKPWWFMEHCHVIFSMWIKTKTIIGLKSTKTFIVFNDTFDMEVRQVVLWLVDSSVQLLPSFFIGSDLRWLPVLLQDTSNQSIKSTQKATSLTRDSSMNGLVSQSLVLINHNGNVPLTHFPFPCRIDS